MKKMQRQLDDEDLFMSLNALKNIGEYHDYQWYFATPPFISHSPSAGESSHLIPTSFTEHPTSIPLQSDIPLFPLLLYCGWVCEGVLCTFATENLQDFRAHCGASHFAGPKEAPIACEWQNCHYTKRGDPTVHVMRRDSIWRHTCEKHLFMKRGA
ncbi:hypothetical protein BDR06DRAFT_999895 [Suillus hirtellus]|nr:hypothetical protein BDR06DRAFT_999895 [Suillus hirtellus]